MVTKRRFLRSKCTSSDLLFSIFLIFSFSLNAAAQTPSDEPTVYGTNISLHDCNETNHTRNGYDWSMPEWLQPNPNSAFYADRIVNGKPKDELLLEAGYRGNFKRKLVWNWKKFESSEGN